MCSRECVLTDHVPSVARVGCTEGPYGETGSMLGSCLYRARWGRTYMNETCVYRANRAILVCTKHYMRDTWQLIEGSSIVLNMRERPISRLDMYLEVSTWCMHWAVIKPYL
jgi:hypothetical protein